MPEILRTKLFRPPITPDLLLRDRLLARLESNLWRPLTLLSAPPGSGKSVLVRTWLGSYPHPSAWLSLDPGDDDLHTFFFYLLAAVQNCCQTFQSKTQETLESQSSAASAKLGKLFLHDLDQIKQRMILVLDDLQHIQHKEIFDLLDMIILQQHPKLHLVLISRHDPPLAIISLRSRNLVTEIRMEDLRFNVEEIHCLLQRMSTCNVDDSIAAEWARRTEGWVTGLRLAILSARHRGDQNFSMGTIPGDTRYLSDYILTEVITQLTPSEQKWLLSSSILDRFCANLCDALCGSRADTNRLTGKQFINLLERNNLFLIHLDDKNHWFRYHHLFQENLQDLLALRLSKEEINTLHQHASRWYANQGLLGEAIKHALKAENPPAAVQVVVEHRDPLMNTQQWYRLQRLLDLIPGHVLSDSPFLICTQAHLSMQFARYHEVATAVQQVEQLLSSKPRMDKADQQILAEIDLLRYTLNSIRESSHPTILGVKKTINKLPPQAVHIRMTAQATLASSLQKRGRYQHALEIIQGSLGQGSQPREILANNLYYLGLLQFAQGDLSQILPAGHKLLRLGEAMEKNWILSRARHHLGVSYYYRNELDQAEQHLLAAFQNRIGASPGIIALITFALALVYAAQERWDQSWRVMDQGHDHFNEFQDRTGLLYENAFRVELALRQGATARAYRLSHGVDFEQPIPTFCFYVPRLTRVKLLLAEGSLPNLHQARRILERENQRMRKIHRQLIRVQCLPLLALVYDLQGETPAAYSILTEAIKLGEQGSNYRSFIDLGAPMADLFTRWRNQTGTIQKEKTPVVPSFYIRTLQAAFHEAEQRQSFLKEEGKKPAPSAPEVPLADTSLTRRETQVLNKLDSDLTQLEIARELNITKATIHTHIKNIYRKLGVNKRRQAVQRGKEIGLL